MEIRYVFCSALQCVTRHFNLLWRISNPSQFCLLITPFLQIFLTIVFAGGLVGLFWCAFEPVQIERLCKIL